MQRRTTDNDDADGGSAEAGAAEERSSAAAISTPPGSPSSAGANTTTSPSTAAPSTAGVEIPPSSDDAPAPLAQTLAAYDEAEEGDKKNGVEVIDSSGLLVPVAMMDTSFDEAEKGAAGSNMAGKSVELAEKGSGKGGELVEDDDEGPVRPGHTADDGGGLLSKKLKAGRVRDDAPGITADDGGGLLSKKLKAARVRDDAPGIIAEDNSVHEPVFEEDHHTPNLVTVSASRGGSFPSGDAGGPKARSRQREVPRPSPAESTVPVFHEVHARLVEDEPDQPVYDAVPVGEEHWAKRQQRKIIGGFVLVIVVLVVALGVAFGTGGGGGEDAARTVIVATASLSPTSSASPTSQPTMVAWSGFSGLSPDTESDTTLYAVGDSAFKMSKIFTIDTTSFPIMFTEATFIKDTNDVFQTALTDFGVGKDDVMINDDKTVNIDSEGIVAIEGGFWIAHEGRGTVGDYKRPVESLNMLFKTDEDGVIEKVVALPDDVNAIQLRFGFEGVTAQDDYLIVAFQRAWGREPNPRLGIYNTNTETGDWKFVYYPLDEPTSQNGGWVGLSDITYVDEDVFWVLERDNQAGPDAAIKRIYSISLDPENDGADVPVDTIEKTLVKDVLPIFSGERGGLALEKLEGLAYVNDGAWVVNDVDIVDTGETQLRYLPNLK